MKPWGEMKVEELLQKASMVHALEVAQLKEEIARLRVDIDGQNVVGHMSTNADMHTQHAASGPGFLHAQSTNTDSGESSAPLSKVGLPGSYSSRTPSPLLVDENDIFSANLRFPSRLGGGTPLHNTESPRPERRWFAESSARDGGPMSNLASRHHRSDPTASGGFQEVGFGQIPASVKSNGTHGSAENRNVLGGLGWPATLPLRSVFAESGPGRMESLSRHLASKASLASDESDIHNMDSGDTIMERKGWCRGLDPNSWSRVVYDLISFVMLVHDLTVTPYVVAWNVPMKGVVYILAFISPSFWTLDIMLNFFTGYDVDGQVFMDLRLISRRYMKHGFLIDFFVTVCDWVGLLFATSLRGVQLQRVTRVGRLLRIIALLRVARTRWFDFGGAVSLVGVFMSAFLTMIFAMHLTVCLWQMLGEIEIAGVGEHWSDATWYDRAPWHYQYWTAFHWATVQWTGSGSNNIEPTNSLERIFTSLILLVGLFFGSVLISWVSALVFEQQQRNQVRTEKLLVLQKFLIQNKVDSNLAVRVQRQVRERIDMNKPLAEKDVAALSELSAPMLSSLKRCIFAQYLARYPLFRVWDYLDGSSMQMLCDKAVRFVFLAPGDVLFDHSHPITRACLVIDGTLQYKISSDTMPLAVDLHNVPANSWAMKGQWLCEAALWCQWQSVGVAEAQTFCHLLSVSSEVLGEIARRKARIRAITADYAKCFHKAVAASKPPFSAWPTDICVPYTDYEDLVPKMEKDSRSVLGRVALNELSQRWVFKSSKVFNQLAEDVSKGKCTLVMTITGECVRLVTLAALRLKCYDGRILMQVGEYTTENGIVPGCKMPGAKIAEAEQPRDVVDRIIHTELSTIAEGINVKTTQREVERKESKEYGIQTKYLRVIFHATLDEAYSLPSETRVPYQGQADTLHLDRKMSGFSAGEHHHTRNWRSCNGWLSKTLNRRKERHSFHHQSSIQAFHELLESLVPTPVYMLERDGKIRYFAWLTEEDVELVTESSLGERALRMWIGGLSGDAAATRSSALAANRDVVDVSISASASAIRSSLSPTLARTSEVEDFLDEPQQPSGVGQDEEGIAEVPDEWRDGEADEDQPQSNEVEVIHDGQMGDINNPIQPGLYYEV